jgi:hypothetical protein
MQTVNNSQLQAIHKSAAAKQHAQLSSDIQILRTLRFHLLEPSGSASCSLKALPSTSLPYMIQSPAAGTPAAAAAGEADPVLLAASGVDWCRQYSA